MTSTIQLEATEKAQSRRPTLHPLTDRNIADRLANKKVIVVFCDEQFEESSKLFSLMIHHETLPHGLKTMKWSEFRSQLSGLSADIVLINSLPANSLTEDPIGLAISFKGFREANPSSVVIAVSFWSHGTPAGAVLGLLEKENLVRVDPGPVKHDILLESGLSAHENKPC